MFACPMQATFNVAADGDINAYQPARIGDMTWPNEQPHLCWFWLLRLPGDLRAWAMRWQGTGLPGNRLEIISKRRLPDSLRDGEFEIGVCEPWTDDAIAAWAASTYQWQGFDWCPTKRADSARVWHAIEPRVQWSGADLLDIGSHYGYHAYQASRAGAYVRAVEPDDETRENAQIINDHIERADVEFLASDPGGAFDVILYLSVQHQHDPGYERLAETVAALKARARQAVFVEVILPPMFGAGLSESQVDAMVGGDVLDTYQHKVRGVRRLYRVKGGRQVGLEPETERISATTIRGAFR
jgi:hypothetical protein